LFFGGGGRRANRQANGYKQGMPERHRAPPLEGLR
jgi:hypothetical protein